MRININSKLLSVHLMATPILGIKTLPFEGDFPLEPPWMEPFQIVVGQNSICMQSALTPEATQEPTQATPEPEVLHKMQDIFLLGILWGIHLNSTGASSPLPISI